MRRMSAARRKDGSPFTPVVSASAKRSALRLTGGQRHRSFFPLPDEYN
jgi:hypothetical protein